MQWIENDVVIGLVRYIATTNILLSESEVFLTFLYFFNKKVKGTSNRLFQAFSLWLSPGKKRVTQLPVVNPLFFIT